MKKKSGNVVEESYAIDKRTREQKRSEPIYGKDAHYKMMARECKKAGLTPPCPHCSVKYRGGITQENVMWLDKNPAMNPVSRRNKESICRVCGKTEAIADFMGFTDDMARVVVDQDRQEAMRLPPGIFWGVSQWPTGGFDEWCKEYERRYAEREKINA